LKILFNCTVPFLFVHGGQQIQIEQTMGALEKSGVGVEPLRWWDENQRGDILHNFGPMDPALLRLAHAHGWRVVITMLFTALCNRTPNELLIRQLIVRPLLAAPLPRSLKDLLPWRGFRMCDRMIVGIEAERKVVERVYGIKKERISLVPLGLAEAYLKAGPATRSENHLVCSGTIGPAKNCIELAKLAIAAQTPLLFVGKPFDFNSDYWREFASLIDGKIINHHPHVGGQAALIPLLQSARGYVLMSTYENWSLAAHEAAACGLPLLVPDKRWSRERFGDQVRFWPEGGFETKVRALRDFYDRCPKLGPPQIHLHSWTETAQALQAVYEDVLRHDNFKSP
jgi:glycosyltransferase involved in cell wall biosynthesis